MTKIFKVDNENKFVNYVNIREEFKEISFPEDLSLAKLPEGYAKATFEDVVFEIGYITIFDEIPTLTENGWVIKFKEKIKEEVPVYEITEVAMRQAKLAILSLGYYDSLEEAVNKNTVLQIEWTDAMFYKESNLMEKLIEINSLNEEAVKEIFNVAITK